MFFNYLNRVGRVMEIIDLFLTLTLPIILALAILVITTYLGVIRPLGKIEERTENIQTEIHDTTSKMTTGLIEITKRITDPNFIKAFREGKSPLTPEQIKRRDELLQKGRKEGLASEEVEELRPILEQGARESAAGNILAFLGFLFLIGLLLAALSGD